MKSFKLLPIKKEGYKSEYGTKPSIDFFAKCIIHCIDENNEYDIIDRECFSIYYTTMEVQEECDYALESIFGSDIEKLEVGKWYEVNFCYNLEGGGKDYWGDYEDPESVIEYSKVMEITDKIDLEFWKKIAEEQYKPREVQSCHTYAAHMILKSILDNRKDNECMNCCREELEKKVDSHEGMINKWASIINENC